MSDRHVGYVGALVEGAVAPDAAVLVAPMLGVKAIGGAGFGEWLAKLMGGVGDSARRSRCRDLRSARRSRRRSGPCRASAANDASR